MTVEMTYASNNSIPIPVACRLLRPAILLALLLVCFFTPHFEAQRGGGGGGGGINGGGSNGGGGNGGYAIPSPMDQEPLYQGRGMAPGGEDPIMHERRMKALNAERQKSMINDTNKLLKLTTELNAEVNGDHPEPLNSDQLRKVAEIEKLAKSVRDKMSTPVGGASPMLMPQTIIPLMQ
jgi:hypothetical protein